MHARTQIRKAVATELAKISEFGGHVYTSIKRAYKQQPCITILTPHDDPDHSQTADMKIMHELTLRLEIRHMESDDIDDELDDLCALVETKMFVDPTFGGKVKKLTLDSTDSDQAPELQREAGLSIIEYTCIYRVMQDDPETIVS